MRQLRSYLDPALATGPQRPLLVQRLRPLLQDERHQQTSRQTKKKNGKPVWRFLPTTTHFLMFIGIQLRIVHRQEFRTQSKLLLFLFRVSCYGFELIFNYFESMSQCSCVLKGKLFLI